MKSFKLQFHKDRAAEIDKAVKKRNEAYGEPDRLVINWHPWTDDGTVLECSLSCNEIEIVSEAIYLCGPDSIVSRYIMDKIIFKLLLSIGNW